MIDGRWHRYPEERPGEHRPYLVTVKVVHIETGHEACRMMKVWWPRFCTFGFPDEGTFEDDRDGTLVNDGYSRTVIAWTEIPKAYYEEDEKRQEETKDVNNKFEL